MTSQYLYQLHPTRSDMLVQGPLESEVSILKAHLKYLDELTEKSVVLLAGRTQTTDDSTFGIVILKAESETTALDIMKNDPAVKEGVMHAKLFPYKIAMVSPEIINENNE